MIDWQKDVVRRTLEGAGDYPGVQLQFLLQRLEEHPEAVSAIADAIRDMGHWFLAHAAALDAEGRRRNGGAEIVDFATAQK
jgi:ABC-type nitrate/sulfonate/bicarbonate transport system substrate-binding protein